MSPLRRVAPALPEGEPRAWWVSMDGGRAKGAVGIDGGAKNFGLSVCVKFAHSPCLSLRERYLPTGGGEGCADSGCWDAASYKV